jgi:hypothetical protein
MPADFSDRRLSARTDPFSQLPPHIAVQYAYLRRAASLAEALADLIILARDYMRTVTAVLTGRRPALPAPANSDTKSAPLMAAIDRASTKAANSDPAPRIA